ncbi:ABC transporter permease [Methylobrevis pamukkalensis]|uniref:Putative 2-aminoethylphosphonate transport system permease protein PhnU n=1 Tax=Methylobrevis pamukkalensis TaxID=1439726 RepID=A0A1E3H017_9HYPH|nr:iron ABC transporter permease [Methylobrevis pamukkalensis]ODN69624.1 putative 2-aminoethylphosphonate transport system permease protein PhnU [Methylobrevis pamukkalensis]
MTTTADPEATTRPLRRPASVGGLDILSLLVVLLVLTPVGGLVYFAVQGSGDLWPHLLRNVIPTALWTSLLLLAGVGVMVAAIGVGAAWLIAGYVFPGRRILEWALLLPLSVPTYILAYAYLDVMHPVGPVQTALRALFGLDSPQDLWFPEIRSLGGAIFLLGFVLYPYVYLPARALFMMQSPTVIEVARTLGSGPARTFLTVALPLARPAIAVGTSLALMEALNDIGASEFLGVRTLTVAIYTTWVTRSSIEGAAQIALLMLIVVFALVVVERIGRRHQRFVGRGGRQHQAAPVHLAGGRAALACLACVAPVAIGFMVPTAYLVVEAARRIRAFGLPADLGTWVANSVTSALAATLVAVAVGLVVAYTARFSRARWSGALVRLSGIGYTVPGTVLAVGLLIPMTSLDNAVDGAARSLLGLSTGLLLTGSGAALVLAYVVRFLAISSGGIEAGLAKISPSLDSAARCLGAGHVRLLGRIHAPMLRPAITAAALLVFVDCMKELPITLLLRPFNFETLATHVYGEAARGTYEDGAVAALMIVIVGLAPIILLARTSFRGGDRGPG